MNSRRVSFCILTLTSVLSISAPAQWSTDPTTNTPVCNAVLEQYYPEIIHQDSGGVIVA